MNILSKIVTSSVDTVIDSIAQGLDSLFTSDEEKQILQNKLEQIRLNSKIKNIELVNEHEKEITKRWLSDNENIITRLVRPLSFVFVLVLFGAIVLTDGNIGEFKIKATYIPVIETLLTTMVIAYFGSRGFEKVSKTFNKSS